MTRFASAAPATKAALVVALLLGVLGLWAALACVIALLGLHRFSAHLDPTAIPGWFLYFRHDLQVARWLKIGGLGSGLGIAALGIGAAAKVRRPLHGAARFASDPEIRREGLHAKAGIVLGRRRGRVLVSGGAEHVLLYAPTRSGKGVGVVIPTLLSWPHAAVVLDVKRENFTVTAGFRAAHGQTVHLFDPLAADGRTARYNPLGHIDRRDSAETLDELQKIAAMLFPAAGDRADPFWAEAARTGLVGVGAYVAETPALPFTLGQIFRELTQGQPKTRFPDLIAARAQAGHPLSTGCVSALTDFCAASDNTFASIRQTITARMGLWLNPRVDVATAASDFDLRTLREDQVTLYLGASPDNIVRVAPLYNLLFQQLVDLNTRTLPRDDRSGQLLLLLDEFARLGHAGVIAHGFAFVAGYGLRILAVLQSPSQLRAAYGPDLAEEIASNCGVEVAFTPKELKIAQELSARLGDYTYEGRSRSRPSGLSSGRRSVSESDQRRPLMLPQELLQMPRDRLLVLRAGIPAIRGEKLAYYRERAFRARLAPPPEIPVRASPAVQAADSAPPQTAVAAEAIVTLRPMTPAEAAREAPLTEAQITLALDEVGLTLPPDRDTSDAAIRALAEGYFDAVASPPDSTATASKPASGKPARGRRPSKRAA